MIRRGRKFHCLLLPLYDDKRWKYVICSLALTFFPFHWRWVWYRQRWSSLSDQGSDRMGGRLETDHPITQEVFCLVLAYLCVRLAMAFAAL